MKGESASAGFWIFIAVIMLSTFIIDANAIKDVFMRIVDGCFVPR